MFDAPAVDDLSKFKAWLWQMHGTGSGNTFSQYQQLLNLMNTSFIVIIFLYVFLSACGKCDDDLNEDMYGEHLELEIPFASYPNRDTFNIGDTFWIEITIPRNVGTYNSNKTILLDTFNFYTDFYISEISDSIVNYNINLDTLIVKGSLSYLTLPTSIVYPITYSNNAESREFKAGVILHEPGLYYIGLNTDPLLFEYYDHPALIICGDNKRDRVDVYYTNSSSSLQNYENIFRQTKVQYLLDIVDFERFSKGGAVAIVVR